MSTRRNVPAIQVFLLGGFRVIIDGRELTGRTWLRRKALQLFKLLLTRPNHRVAEDEAAELLWPKSDPSAVRSTIGSTLSTIRGALGWTQESGNADLLLRDHGMLAILPEAGIWVDADAFEQLLQRAKHVEDPYPLLEEADRLYTGEYLPNDRYEIWSSERREALKRLRTELQFDLAQHRERRGNPEGASAALEAVLREDGCDERAARELMQLHTRHGRRTDALRLYQQLVKALKDELGVEPSQETVDVWRRISSGTSPPPGPAAPPAPTTVQMAPEVIGMAATSSLRGEDRLAPSQFTPAYPFPTPERLVGRQGELDILESIVERGRAGRQVVLVSAPAGTGKSALVGALVQRARRAGFLCLVGGGYEGEGIIPLGPFHDALSDYLLWQPAERIRAELAGGLDDLTLLVPELGYHLDLPRRPPSDPSTDRVRLFGSIHAYLRGLTERHPVLLCLEDLHAADAATLALIEFLARQMVRQKLVILGTFRTEELRPGRPLSDLVTALRRRNAEQIDLKPLSRQNTTRLVATLLEGQPSDRLTDSLYTTTEGNPLFVEQLVLALREEGRLDQRGGTWRQIGDVSGVPTIVRDVIGQRLDRLSESARQTLAMAAVMGQAFEYGALLAASEQGDDEIHLMEDLDEAFDAQILHDTPTGYAFGHALLREVAYGRLMAPRKMLLHGRAGRGLERWADGRANERAAELARHFSLAGPSPEVLRKALHYSLEAGRRAAALSSHREALEHFERACELTEARSMTRGLDDQLDALEGRGHAERELGRWLAAVDSFRKVLTFSEEPLQRARVHGALAYGYHHMGDLAQALTEADAGLADLTSLDPDPRIILATLRIQFAKSLVWFLQGRYRNLAGLGDEMVALAGQTAEPLPLTWAHSAVAWSHLGMGQVEQALSQYALAMRAAERSASRVEIAILHDSIGIQSYRGGRFAEALEHLERSIVIHCESASELRTVNAVQTLGRLWLAWGDIELAQHHARTALDLAVEGRHRWAAECHDLFGQIHAVRCEWDDALSSFQQALEIRERVGHVAGLVESLLGCGLVCELHGHWPQAMYHYRRALEIAEAMDPSPQLVMARCHVGLLTLHLGDDSAASEQIETGVALAEAMPERLEYGHALLAVAELALETGAANAAAEHAEKALTAARTVDLAIRARAILVTADVVVGQLDAADALSADVLQSSEQFGSPHLLGLARLSAGRLAAAHGRRDEALTLLEAATIDFTRAGTPYGQGLALLEHGRVLLQQTGKTDVVASHLASALELFQTLGAARAVEQAQRLLDGTTDEAQDPAPQLCCTPPHA